MTKPARPWTEEEDSFIEENYSGLFSIPIMARALGRTEVATERRIRIIHSQPAKIGEDADLMACIKHGEDLKRSGKRWT
jgi:hypothetical protein